MISNFKIAKNILKSHFSPDKFSNFKINFNIGKESSFAKTIDWRYFSNFRFKDKTLKGLESNNTNQVFSRNALVVTRIERNLSKLNKNLETVQKQDVC